MTSVSGQASMDFVTIKKLSANSRFNPVIPNNYTSAENLWATLIEQAYAHDTLCINRRSVFNKKSKRFQMLAKLVYAYEDTIWKAEHAELMAKNINAKSVHLLEAQLEDKDVCNIERGKQICVLQSQLLEKDKYYADVDKEMAELYTEIHVFRDKVASNEVLIAELQSDLISREQMISNMQKTINELSTHNIVIPNKQVCITDKRNSAAGSMGYNTPKLMPTIDHRDPISSVADPRYPVERTLNYSPSPMQHRSDAHAHFSDDQVFGLGSGWETVHTAPTPQTNHSKDTRMHIPHRNYNMERTQFLLKIRKEIPKYDPSIDPFTSCDIFEGHCDKFSVAPEHRMELFKLWLPTHLNQRYAATGKTTPKNGQFHDSEERLSALMKLATGHWEVTPDILYNFKPTIHDEPLSLCGRFEAMYRKVTKDQGTGVPQGMIRMFVEKFPYVDTAIRLSAAKEPALADAAMMIEEYRQDLLKNSKSLKVREYVVVNGRPQDYRNTTYGNVHRTPHLTPTAPPQQKWLNIQCYACLKFGHVKRNCPQFIRKEYTSNSENLGNNNGFKKPQIRELDGQSYVQPELHQPNEIQKCVALVSTHTRQAEQQSQVPVQTSVTPQTQKGLQHINNCEVQKAHVAVHTTDTPTGNLMQLD